MKNILKQGTEGYKFFLLCHEYTAELSSLIEGIPVDDGLYLVRKFILSLDVVICFSAGEVILEFEKEIILPIRVLNSFVKLRELKMRIFSRRSCSHDRASPTMFPGLIGTRS